MSTIDLNFICYYMQFFLFDWNPWTCFLLETEEDCHVGLLLR
jgi:hypothetical protein